jgi:hypothetical protein
MNCKTCNVSLENKKKCRGECLRCYQKENKKARANTPVAKAKRRRNKIFAKYKITMAEYEAMNRKQSGKCAICFDLPENQPYGVLCIDHCHKTGKVRGLLCKECNTGLGRFEDKLQILSNAIDYLKAHQ